MKGLKKFSIIFIMGFISYICLEVLFGAFSGSFYKEAYCMHKHLWSLMGVSSFWMGIVGGILLWMLGIINEISFFRQKFCMLVHAIVGAFLITLLEFLSGVILNIWLGLNIWDYSHYAFNLLGQINLGTSFLWLLVAPLAFWVDDMIRWLIYHMKDDEYSTIHVIKRKENLHSLLWYYKQLFVFKAVRM